MKIPVMRRFIQTEILENESVAIEDDEDLMLSGTLDSSSVMQLIGYIEESVGISVAEEDIVPENFGSLQKIEAYLLARGLGA